MELLLRPVGQLRLGTHAICEDELLPEWLAMHELNRE